MHFGFLWVYFYVTFALYICLHTGREDMLVKFAC